MANVRVISDGTSEGTKIVNADTGEELPGEIDGVDWSATFDATGNISFFCTVSFKNPEVDLLATETEAAIVPLPGYGEG